MMFDEWNEWVRRVLRHIKFAFALSLLAAPVVLPDTVSAQLGRGTLEPMRFTTSDDGRLASQRVRIADLPRIATAVEGGPAWYSEGRYVSVSIYSSGTARGGYALRVNENEAESSRSPHVVVPVAVPSEILNTAQVPGCASPVRRGIRWLALPESPQVELNPPPMLVQAIRFC